MATIDLMPYLSHGAVSLSDPDISVSDSNTGTQYTVTATQNSGVRKNASFPLIIAYNEVLLNFVPKIVEMVVAVAVDGPEATYFHDETYEVLVFNNGAIKGFNQVTIGTMDVGVFYPFNIERANINATEEYFTETYNVFSGAGYGDASTDDAESGQAFNLHFSSFGFNSPSGTPVDDFYGRVTRLDVTGFYVVTEFWDRKQHALERPL